MRKIIQLTIISFKFFGITTGYRQFALCDDNTIWYRDGTNKNSAWREVDDFIPGTIK